MVPYIHTDEKHHFLRGLFISSTGTGIGKTIVTAGIGVYCREICQRRIRIWKPVQSGVTLGDPEADSYRLRMGSGLLETPEEEIVTWTLPDPLAPWMAFERAGVPFAFGRLLEEGRRRQEDGSFLLVEGAGGIAVPFSAEYTMADAARELGTPVLLVASPGLGTVSHTVTAVQYARERGITDIAVVFSGPRSLADEREIAENARMIEAMAGVPVCGIVPWLMQPADAQAVEMEAWVAWREQWLESFVRMEKMMDWLRKRI
ncbi:dethiobiotin synthase [Paenibacillus sp. cl6col]|uniref:ATP-dependent dethiobiotin synthetase BioD n=1 Tax=Paenibacillus alvei TaxID=44250 RepID=A0ABT4E2C8_PAEAL|nr:MULTISPECIES: dethiobiotin synthase [Paenibacillus]MCY9527882.1 dethiobiotin synthase [Paenibacillus alvei]SDF36636.1 dethiobiotin synthase [Paenibacillus sp. cl6col]